MRLPILVPSIFCVALVRPDLFDKVVVSYAVQILTETGGLDDFPPDLRIQFRFHDCNLW